MSDVKYPITGSVWFRKSTQEWVLELEGSINGTYFIDRHTEPSTTLPEDVPGLPSLYEKIASGLKLRHALGLSLRQLSIRALRSCMSHE